MGDLMADTAALIQQITTERDNAVARIAELEAERVVCCVEEKNELVRERNGLGDSLQECRAERDALAAQIASLGARFEKLSVMYHTRAHDLEPHFDNCKAPTCVEHRAISADLLDIREAHDAALIARAKREAVEECINRILNYPSLHSNPSRAEADHHRDAMLAAALRAQLDKETP